jgi:hypothetical protein
VWEGVVSLLGAANQRRKKMTTKIRHGLRRLPTNEKSHNNQPKACRRDEGGEGGELRLARGALGKRESIVWGQSSCIVHQINTKLMCLLKKNSSLPDH